MHPQWPPPEAPPPEVQLPLMRDDGTNSIPPYNYNYNHHQNSSCNHHQYSQLLPNQMPGYTQPLPPPPPPPPPPTPTPTPTPLPSYSNYHNQHQYLPNSSAPLLLRTQQPHPQPPQPSLSYNHYHYQQSQQPLLSHNNNHYNYRHPPPAPMLLRSPQTHPAPPQPSLSYNHYHYQQSQQPLLSHNNYHYNYQHPPPAPMLLRSPQTHPPPPQPQQQQYISISNQPHQHSRHVIATSHQTNKKQKLENNVNEVQSTLYTNKELMSTLPSGLINTKHSSGQRFTAIEIEQISNIEEVGFQHNFNSHELAFIEEQLMQYMPNYELSANNKPRMEKSSKTSSKADDWIYESKLYINNDNRDEKVRITRATNSKHPILLFCPNESLLQSIYNKRARKRIMDTHPMNKLVELVSAFRSPLSSVSSSVATNGSMNELVSIYIGLDTKVKKADINTNINTKTVASNRIPPVMTLKSKQRFVKDTEEKRIQKKKSDINARLVMVATEQYATSKEELETVKVNTLYTSNVRALHSLMPFGHISKTYVYVAGCDFADLPDTVFIENESCRLSDFEVGQIKYNGRLGPRVLVDANNYAYLFVRDHFDNKRLDVVAKTCMDIGDWDMFPVILQILCANEVFHKCHTSTPVATIATQKTVAGIEKSSDIGSDMCRYIEKFISGCFTSLILELDFYRMDINEVLDRIPWVMWNMMAFEFYDKVDSNMQKRMDEMKVILNEKVKAMLPSPVDESSVEYKQLYNSIREKSRDFHYVIIMAISGSSSDTNTRNCYERLMLGKLDSLSFLKDIGRVKNFMMFFEGLVEIMRRYSLYVSGALAVITIAVTSVVDCDGDIPRGTRLTSIEQMLDKKARITENTKAMFTHDMKDFIGIGLDTHVKRVLKILIYLYLTKHTNKTISMNDAERYAFIVADWIDPTIGVYCNEVLAQLGQYMDSKSAECKEILDAVFKKVSGDDPLYKEAIKMWQGK